MMKYSTCSVFLALQLFTSLIAQNYLTVVCWIASYFFWLRHMLLAGKIFCYPRIQLFFTIIFVGIINTGANYAEPPVAASLIPIVNSVAICGDVFRGFIPKFANLANFSIQTWTTAAFIWIVDGVFWCLMHSRRWCW